MRRYWSLALQNITYQCRKIKHGKMGWYQDFKEFSDGTSAHGVKWIFHPSVHGSHKVVKVIFLVAWLSAIGYSMFVIYNAILNFAGKPTGTKFQVVAKYNKEAEKSVSIDFPTISVCSHNVISKSYFESNDHLEDLWTKFDSWDPEEAKKIDFSDGSNFAKYRDVTYEEILKQAGPPNSTFKYCKYFLQPCETKLNQSLGEFYEREASISGNCFRINPKGKLRGESGNYGKMQLIFFADLNDYSSLTRREPEYGYTVAIHDHKRYSSTMPSGFWMSPGFIYKVDLSLTREFREPPPAGNCDPLKVNNTYGRYEENSCAAQCRDDALMEKCGCIHVMPPLPHNIPDKTYRGCTLEEWAKCGLGAYKEWVLNNSDANKMQTQCKCPPTCKETQYKAQLSSSQISKLFAESKTHLLPPGYNSTQHMLENLLIIDVLFTSMQVSEIREIVTYGWGNFLGDVGGVLGLFLGASMFTVMEFLEFIILAICKSSCDFRKRPGDHHQHKEI